MRLSTDAQATFRAASNRLAPVVWALKGLDSEVVGAAALAEKLQDAHALLAAELGIIGQALAELAARADPDQCRLQQADQALAAEARALR